MQFTACSNDGLSICTVLLTLNNKQVFSGTRKGIQPVNSAIHTKVYWPNHGRDNPHTKLKWLLCRCTWVGRFLNMLQKRELLEQVARVIYKPDVPPVTQPTASKHALITFRMSRRQRKMYVGQARLCVSVSCCIPTLLHGPRCKLGEWQGVPPSCAHLADLQSVHGFRCYDNRAECEISVSACTRSTPGFNFVQAPGTDQNFSHRQQSDTKSWEMLWLWGSDEEWTKSIWRSPGPLWPSPEPSDTGSPASPVFSRASTPRAAIPRTAAAAPRHPCCRRGTESRSQRRRSCTQCSADTACWPPRRRTHELPTVCPPPDDSHTQITLANQTTKQQGARLLAARYRDDALYFPSTTQEFQCRHKHTLDER